MLNVGSFYTRDQIHSRLGGGLQDYLPHKNLRVVCGCFRTDTNPAAPEVILPGIGPDIQKWARVFRNQKYPQSSSKEKAMAGSMSVTIK
jgi:hypothetical protein